MSSPPNSVADPSSVKYSRLNLDGIHSCSAASVCLFGVNSIFTSWPSTLMRTLGGGAAICVRKHACDNLRGRAAGWRGGARDSEAPGEGGGANGPAPANLGTGPARADVVVLVKIWWERAMERAGEKIVVEKRHGVTFWFTHHLQSFRVVVVLKPSWRHGPGVLLLETMSSCCFKTVVASWAWSTSPRNYE